MHGSSFDGKGNGYAQAASETATTDEPVDEACETIRRHAVKLLEALWDAEYQRREEDGLSLATFEKLRRAHDEIGLTLNLIRLEA